MTSYDVLIVGAGHAGAHCATALRHAGFAGSIGMLGDEAELPYERPSLSKDYLAGAKTFEQMLFHAPTFWQERQIAILHGRRVAAIQALQREVTCSNGERFGYGKLVWAAGGRARRLDCNGATLDGVHVVRTRADVDRLKAALAQVQQVVVIGAGFIGLEVAATLVGQGKQVSVVEAAGRVLARVSGEQLASFIASEHRRHGVQLRLGAGVVSLTGHAGRVSGVALDDGSVLPAQLVVVGIGIEPEVAPLVAAGAGGPAGVEVDHHCQTSLADVYAIGDCARQVNAFAQQAMVRIESVQNATEQAQVVASHIVGRPIAPQAVPWFWSVQYDLRLQMAGLSAGHDEVVVRDAPASKSLTVAYLREGVLVALDCINATRDFVQGRTAVGKQVRPDRQALADPTVAISSFYS